MRVGIRLTESAVEEIPIITISVWGMEGYQGTHLLSNEPCLAGTKGHRCYHKRGIQQGT